MKKIITLLLFTVTIALNANAQIKEECLSGNCVTGKGIKKYANGAAYDGEFMDSLRNGFGVMVWQGGDKYIGDWKAGHRTGKGKYYYSNKDMYEGDFSDGKFDGKGTMIYNNGSKYMGDWKAGYITGKGKVYYAEGGSYEGDFLNNTLHGKGTKIYKDSSVYTGEWKADNRHGIGKYIYANGTILEGDFENDKFMDPGNKSWFCISGNCYDGIGTKNLEFGSSTTYTGQFKYGRPEGEGILKEWGTTYKGKFKDGMKNGFGTYTEKNGSTYTGIWERNDIVEGTFTDTLGNGYTGKWVYLGEKGVGNGRERKYNGEGVETNGFNRGMGIGIKTKGTWKDGIKIGKFIEQYPTGYYKEVHYKEIGYKKYETSEYKYFNNQNIQINEAEFDAKNPYQYCSNGNCKNGIGSCEFDNRKTIYIGYFKNYKKDGFVAAFDRTGTYYYGIWKEDSLITKIDTTEAKKYLSANPKVFFQFLNSSNYGNDERSKSLAAAVSLIGNCNTSTCTAGNCKNGYGTEEDCEGNIYTGNFANGAHHGKGKLTYANGDLYDGYWVNNARSGKGKYTGKYGDYYDGDWVSGKKEGKGKYEYISGNTYEGDWVNDVIQGKGKLTYYNGNGYYNGNWVNGLRHGKGISVDKEGRVRDGDWVNDVWVITAEQREINQEIRNKISVLVKEIFDTEYKMNKIVSPSDPKEKEEYWRVRKNMDEGLKSARQLIKQLEKQIIE